MLALLFFLSVLDGTLLLSSKPNTLVGNVARRLTGGDKYTHIAVVIEDIVYESNWPRSKATAISSYGHKKEIVHYYEPKIPYTKEEIEKMRITSKSEIGKPYRLKNYLWPNSREVDGGWCSPFVGKVLNASGRYRLNKNQTYEPQNLIDSIIVDYNRIK